MTQRPPASTDRARRWDSLLTTAHQILPAVLRLLGVPEQELEDVLQEVLLAAYRGLDRFDPSRSPRPSLVQVAALDSGAAVAATVPSADVPVRRSPIVFQPVRTHTAESTWLIGIAWRQARHHLERAHRRREVPHAPMDGCFRTASLAESPEQTRAAQERFALTLKVLESVPANRRVVLVLKDALDLPVSEIAALLHVKESTARNRLRLARADYRVAARRLRPDARSLLRPGRLLGLVWPALLLRPALAEAASPPGPTRHPGIAPPSARSRPMRPAANHALGSWLAGVAAATAFLVASASPPAAGARRFGALAMEIATAQSALPHAQREARAAPSGPAPSPASPASPASTIAPAHARPPRESLATERRLLAAAEKALLRSQLARALHFIDAHEQQFPRGQLVITRERLRARARARAAAHAGPASPASIHGGRP
jgi:DNA-directed RNA polymerase specialized sigma24 family protein